MSTDTVVAQIAADVRAQIAGGQVDPLRVMAIVKAAAAGGHPWHLVVGAVEEIAKGADGVEGTIDDLIPAAQMRLLRTLLDSGVVADVAQWVAALAPAAGGKPWWKCW
jgi:hypothetical protein